MSNAEIDERVNLKEIVDISEDEFKRQISAWIDERGISRKLQSKLRADLFDQFNRTKLGRQMSEQHQQAHRIVLSPLILVLNTLVAEFLYSEDCHFTLSVFTNEVPYKNTLPNFEATPSGQLFQFSQTELNDIFEAIGISKQKEDIVREFYLNIGSGGQEVLNKSLLYCIVKTFIAQIESGKCVKADRKNERKQKTKKARVKPSTSSTVLPSTSEQSVDQTSPSDQKPFSYESRRPKYEHLHISSRYFKYLNRYLDILSDRINDMSKSLAEKRSGKKSSRHAADSSTQEESLKKDLRKIIENINKLTKSQKKSKRFQDVLNSIERLSSSVEKCSGKMGDLLNAVSVQAKKNEIAEKKSSDNKTDRFNDMDYASWLRELKTSEHGKKFIDRLEMSLQKTMEKERDNLEKLYEEKTNNYRMLIRLHYKQKYDASKNEQLDSVDRPEKEISSPTDKFTPDDTEKILAESLATRALEKEQQVDQIVQTARTRLQQLERESEDLDQSFQAYLRRQQILKQQVNDDASKIWENYSLSKAALAKFDAIENRNTNTKVYQANLTDTIKVDQVWNSTFNDDVDVQDVLKDLNEIKRLKSPTFNKREAFSKENLMPLKLQKCAINAFIENPLKPILEYEDKMFVAQKVTTLAAKHDIILSEKNSKEIFAKVNRVNGIEKFKRNEEKLNERNDKSGTSLMQPIPISINNDTPLSLAPIKQNGTTKLTTETQPPERKTQAIASTSTQAVSLASSSVPPIEQITNGKKVDSTENGHKSPKHYQHSTVLNNGKTVYNSENTKTSETKREIETTYNPIKVNGFNKVTESSELNKIQDKATEKEPQVADGNGMKPKITDENGLKAKDADENGPKAKATVENSFKPISSMKINGFASKLPAFVSRISDSDSNEAESEQISIGAQRLVKSPDDFWI